MRSALYTTSWREICFKKFRNSYQRKEILETNYAFQKHLPPSSSNNSACSYTVPSNSLFTLEHNQGLSLTRSCYRTLVQPFTSMAFIWKRCNINATLSYFTLSGQALNWNWIIPLRVTDLSTLIFYLDKVSIILLLSWYQFMPALTVQYEMFTVSKLWYLSKAPASMA